MILMGELESTGKGEDARYNFLIKACSIATIHVATWQHANLICSTLVSFHIIRMFDRDICTSACQL